MSAAVLHVTAYNVVRHCGWLGSSPVNTRSADWARAQQGNQSGSKAEIQQVVGIKAASIEAQKGSKAGGSDTHQAARQKDSKS